MVKIRCILNLLVIVSLLVGTWSFSLAAKAREQGLARISSYPMSFQWTTRIRASKRAKGHSLETAVPVMSGSGDTVFIGGIGGYFYALDRVSGDVRWSVDTGGGIEGAATLDGDAVYVGNNKGIVSAFTTTDGAAIWTYNAPTEIITRPVVYGDAIFVSTAADELIRLNKVTGERLESQALALLEPDITLRGHGDLAAVGNVLLIPLSSGGRL
jgi:outer membrane protein assembly factor BamB